MANPADVLMQLNNRIAAKYDSKRAKVDIEDDITRSLEEDQAAKRFIGHYVRRGQGEYRKGDRGTDDVKDVDTLNYGDVDDEYVTHRQGILPYDDYSSYQVHKLGFEQAMPSPEEVGAAAAGGDPTGGAIDTPEEQQAQMGAQPEGMPPDAMQPGMGQVLPEEDVSKKPSDLGRIYELKKIYTRLTVIEAFLTESSDTKLIELRTLVSRGIELFEIVASNMSSYRPPRAPEETIDEIIVNYYRFLERLYEHVAKYYKKRSTEFHKRRENMPTEKPKIRIKLHRFT